MAALDCDGASTSAFWYTVPETARFPNQYWQRVEHLFACADNKRRRPRRPDRDILEATICVEQNQSKWHWLPACYPPAQTCYTRHVAWRRDGVLEQIKDILKDASLDAQQCE
jgi:transposase